MSASAIGQHLKLPRLEASLDPIKRVLQTADQRKRSATPSVAPFWLVSVVIHAANRDRDGLDRIDALSHAAIEILVGSDAIADGRQDVVENAER
jgi:hypothetical protein